MDSNLYSFYLFWSTEDGCEWLEELYTTTDNVLMDELRRIVNDYVKETLPYAENLVSGWIRNGEQVTLFVSAKCENDRLLSMICKILDEQKISAIGA